MMELNKKPANFTGETTDGDFSLKDYQGQILVLYFYPRDNTSGCTQESCDFAASKNKFKKQGAAIVGISRDTLKSHFKFKEKYKLPFPLIADPTEEICNLFGVMKDKNMYGKKVRGIERSTFIFDKKGILRFEWRKVKIPEHVEEVLTKVKELAVE